MGYKTSRSRTDRSNYFDTAYWQRIDVLLHIFHLGSIFLWQNVDREKSFAFENPGSDFIEYQRMGF